MGYRVLLIGESPSTPSSLGKVMLYIAAGLASRGHRVYVMPFTMGDSPSLVSYIKQFSPRREAGAAGDMLADFYPDVDITVIPWGKRYDFSMYRRYLNGDPDAVLCYYYPYIETDLNDIVFRYFTSRNIPAFIYAIHEGPGFDQKMSLSTLAYTAVFSPTIDILSKYMAGLKDLAAKRRIQLPDDAWFNERFKVLPHPVNTDLFSPRAVRALEERAKSTTGRDIAEKVHLCDVVFGMVAKNHIRKDYGALVYAVARARAETGMDICAGAYFIDAVSGGYWKRDMLTRWWVKGGGREEDYDESVYVLPQHLSVPGMNDGMLIYVYSKMMDVHMFLTRGEAFGLPPVESYLLGVPTVTTDIPPQREIFGDRVRYVKSSIREDDSFDLYQPSREGTVEAVIECAQDTSKCSIDEQYRDELASKLDYRRIGEVLEKHIENALRDPAPLSKALGALLEARQVAR